MAEDAGDDRPRRVTAGARVRDRLCGELHTLRRPDRAASDALLVYECAVRDLGGGDVVPVLQTIHIGAILGRLVNGLEQAE